jgi:pyridoxamine 5'-phosphate oxidase
MMLATVDGFGRPSTRMVIVKQVNEDGFTFFTSYQSRKAQDLASNPYASLLGYWPQVKRQISVIGRTHKTSDAVSDAYFAGRPRGSQIVSWASEQSSLLTDPAALASRCSEFNRHFAGKLVPRPPYWGGVVLIPETIEFWLQDEQQLHQRLLFQRQGESGWQRMRLAP